MSGGEFDPGQAFSAPREEFHPELVERQFSNDRAQGLTEIQSQHADYIVRNYARNTATPTPLYEYPPDIDTDQSRYDYLTEVAEYDSTEIGILRDAGIAVPPTYFVVGRDEQAEGELEVFVATHKVEGQSLKQLVAEAAEADEPSPELAEHVSGLIQNLASYYTSAVQERQPFMRDLTKLRQYRFGSWEPGSEQQIWLVDTDPIMVYPHEEQDYQKWLGWLVLESDEAKGIIPGLKNMLERSLVIMSEEQEDEVLEAVATLEAAVTAVLLELATEEAA
jgi:hypothetical protein